MSIGKDLVSSITGNIESALLVIHDYREAAESIGSGAQAAALAARMRSQATRAALGSGVPPTYPGSMDKTLKVQFNPSKLTLNAYVEPVSQRDASTGQSRTQAVEDAKLNLTVVLLFDDMDTFDAFMWEKFTSGLTLKGASNAYKGIADAAHKGKTHSVQWQVESLVAALRNPLTRTISFRWADFSFVGQLNTVRANYTMFSTSGRPIRAEVLLRIQHDLAPNMLQSWYDSFERAFGGDSGNLVRAEQNFSALMNLNL